jgi:hypothetical protein
VVAAALKTLQDALELLTGLIVKFTFVDFARGLLCAATTFDTVAEHS